MTDEMIIQLYNSRDENAIEQTSAQYGNYCRSIASRILEDPLDVEEILADTWTAVWTSIPPQQPKHLRLYIGRITRNLALSRWRRNRTYFRGGGEAELALEELGEIAGGVSPEEELDGKELGLAITAFLNTQSSTQRTVFLRRYFYMDELKEIAKRYGLSESNVRMMLSRTRQRLKKYLEQEGLL